MYPTARQRAEADEAAERAEKDARIAELETALRELLDAFNPAPRVSTSLTIWGRAAMALDGTPDADAHPGNKQ